MILFWCLMPKGEKLKAKVKWVSYHLRKLKIVELGVSTFDLAKFSYMQNLTSCGENVGLWEKGGVCVS
jgi:hypothetical protein